MVTLELCYLNAAVKVMPGSRAALKFCVLLVAYTTLASRFGRARCFERCRSDTVEFFGDSSHSCFTHGRGHAEHAARAVRQAHCTCG